MNPFRHFIFVAALLLAGLSAFGQQKMVKEVNTIADLQRQNPGDIHKTIKVLGYYSPNDGGGGIFVVTNTASSRNIGTRFASTSSAFSWERVQDGSPIIQASHYGVVNGLTDMTERLQTVVDFAASFNADGGKNSVVVQLPRGWIPISSTIRITNSYVTILGHKQIGGNTNWNVMGTTIVATTSGMGFMMEETHDGNTVGIRIEDVRFKAYSGLASPPGGLSLKDTTECTLRGVWFGDNLDVGLRYNGGTLLDLDRCIFSGVAIGIHATIEDTSVFTGNVDFTAHNNWFFNCTTAGVVMDGHTHNTRFNGGFMEFLPLGILITSRADDHNQSENIVIDGMDFFNSVSTPYPNSRFIVAAAQPTATNVFSLRRLSIENCSAVGYGSTNLIDFFISSNTQPASVIRDIVVKPTQQFYGVSSGAINSDSTSVIGEIHGSEGGEGSIVTLSGIYTGTAKPLLIGSTNGWSRYYRSLAMPSKSLIMSHDGVSVLTNSPARMYDGTNLVLTTADFLGGINLLLGKLGSPLAPIDVGQDAPASSAPNGAGIIVSSSDNANPTGYGFANGESLRGLINIPTASSAMQFINMTNNGRLADWKFLQQTNTVFSILESGALELNEITAPDVPASGKVRVYALSDGRVYRKDDGGNVSELGGDSVAIDGVDVSDLLGVNLSSTPFDIDLDHQTGSSPDTINFQFARAVGLGDDPTLLSGYATFGTAGVLFEGTTANAFEGLLTSADVTADRTWTLPDLSGTVALVESIQFDGVSVTDVLGVNISSTPYDIQFDLQTGSSPDVVNVQFIRSADLAGNPTLLANYATIGATGIIFEGATANTSEGLLDAADITADRTWTLPDKDGTIAMTSDITGGGTNSIPLFLKAAKLPPSNPAALDTSEAVDRLLFDDTTEESVEWVFQLPKDYGGSPQVQLTVAFTSATAGNAVFGISVMAITAADNQDVTASSFDTEVTHTFATLGTAGWPQINGLNPGIELSTNDSMTAGDFVRLKFARKVGHASDTAAGDAELVGAIFFYARQ